MPTLGAFPKFRFPEFLNREWTKITLQGCCESLDYGMNAAAKVFDGVNKYIRITDIDDATLTYKSEAPVSPNGELEDKYLVQESDILLARTGASTGKSYLYDSSDGKLYFAGFLIRARVRNEYNARFVFYQTQTEIYNKWVKLMSMRSGQPGINSQEYSGYKFCIPSKQEQDKIAILLTAIDSRIQTQSKIIAQFESLMQGLREEVFSQKLRFKDVKGNDFPDWKFDRFGNIYSFKITNSFSREFLNYDTGQVKNVHYGDIHTKFQKGFDVAKEEVPFVNSNISLQNIEKGNYLQEGDMIFADASEDLNDIGKSIEVVNTNNEKILSGLHTILARPHSNILSIGFGAYLFKSGFVRNQIQREAQGTKVLSISAGRLSNIKIPFPSIPEQQKIVKILSAIDLKIETEKKILKQCEQQKKFLLQNLFI